MLYNYFKVTVKFKYALVKLFLLFYVYECFVYMYVYHKRAWYSGRSEEPIRSSGVVKGGWLCMPCGCWNQVQVSAREAVLC